MLQQMQWGSDCSARTTTDSENDDDDDLNDDVDLDDFEFDDVDFDLNDLREADADSAAMQTCHTHDDTSIAIEPPSSIPLQLTLSPAKPNQLNQSAPVNQTLHTMDM